MESIWLGFVGVFSPINLLACFLGTVLGTIVGVLPGLGPAATVAILLPVTFQWPTTTALIMLCGIVYGAMYGGSTTSILMRIPGESSSVLTAIDGYELAKQGKAGLALAVSAIGSFIAGTLGVIGLQFFAPSLARAAVGFGPPEYLGIGMLGLFLLVNLTGGNLINAWLMLFCGLILGTVGLDPIVGLQRFDFGTRQLGLKGIDLLPVIIGLYGIAEVIRTIEEKKEIVFIKTPPLRELYPKIIEFKPTWLPMLRGGGLGFLMGLIPGPAAVLSTFSAYFIERKISRHPEKFGKGSIEAVAAVESANNGAATGIFVPLMSLGIAFAPSSIMIMAALMMHGVRPGPLLMKQYPELFWSVIASMYIGNVMLLILNLPLVGVFASIMRVRKYYILPIVVVMCIIGTYSSNNDVYDVWVMIVFGFLGYVLSKKGFDVTPMVVGLVIGPLVENSLRQTIIMAKGISILIFICGRPFLAICIVVMVIILLQGLRKAFWKNWF